MVSCRAIIANSEIGPKSVPDSQHSSDAVVLLPPVRGRLTDRSLQRWLSRGRLETARAPVDPLAEVLRAIGRDYPGEGVAALRMWGQTGERPGAWVAAAEPVYMEPRLDRLFLHVLGPGDVSGPELQRLFDTLQETLGRDGTLGFARIGSCGYICSEQPMVTPGTSAAELDGQNPEGALPPADVAADTLNLLSEIEMTLHAQPLNAERLTAGRSPVNSLWLWGGGYAPAPGTGELPLLFGGEPLLRGYWASADASAEPWPGTLAACFDAAPGGFVAHVPPASGASAALDSDLAALRDALRRGRLDSAVLVTADGLRATLRRSDRLRVWRRKARLLEAPTA
jgi:hypothetical protein